MPAVIGGSVVLVIVFLVCQIVGVIKCLRAGRWGLAIGGILLFPLGIIMGFLRQETITQMNKLEVVVNLKQNPKPKTPYYIKIFPFVYINNPLDLEPRIKELKEWLNYIKELERKVEFEKVNPN